MRSGATEETVCADGGSARRFLARSSRAIASAEKRRPPIRRTQAGLLQRVRRGRRAPRGRRARHSVLRPQFQGRVRPDQGLLRRRIPGRPHAQSVRDVQQLAEVRQAVGVRPAGRGRRHRHGPLRPAAARAGRRPARPRRRGPTCRRTSRTSSSGSRGTCSTGSFFPSAVSRSRPSASWPARPGLRVADKPDSQEICFIPDNDYAGFRPPLSPGRRDLPASWSTRPGTCWAGTTGITISRSASGAAWASPSARPASSSPSSRRRSASSSARRTNWPGASSKRTA